MSLRKKWLFHMCLTCLTTLSHVRLIYLTFYHKALIFSCLFFGMSVALPNVNPNWLQVRDNAKSNSDNNKFI